MSKSRLPNRRYRGDWWGTRPFSGMAISAHGMKWWKRKTHKIERRMWKQHLLED